MRYQKKWNFRLGNSAEGVPPQTQKGKQHIKGHNRAIVLPRVWSGPGLTQRKRLPPMQDVILMGERRELEKPGPLVSVKRKTSLLKFKNETLQRHSQDHDQSKIPESESSVDMAQVMHLAGHKIKLISAKLNGLSPKQLAARHLELVQLLRNKHRLFGISDQSKGRTYEEHLLLLNQMNLVKKLLSLQSKGEAEGEQLVEKVTSKPLLENYLLYDMDIRHARQVLQQSSVSLKVKGPLLAILDLNFGYLTSLFQSKFAILKNQYVLRKFDGKLGWAAKTFYHQENESTGELWPQLLEKLVGDQVTPGGVFRACLGCQVKQFDIEPGDEELPKDMVAAIWEGLGLGFQLFLQHSQTENLLKIKDMKQTRQTRLSNSVNLILIERQEGKENRWIQPKQLCNQFCRLIVVKHFARSDCKVIQLQSGATQLKITAESPMVLMPQIPKGVGKSLIGLYKYQGKGFLTKEGGRRFEGHYEGHIRVGSGQYSLKLEVPQSCYLILNSSESFRYEVISGDEKAARIRSIMRGNDWRDTAELAN